MGLRRRLFLKYFSKLTDSIEKSLNWGPSQTAVWASTYTAALCSCLHLTLKSQRFEKSSVVKKYPVHGFSNCLYKQWLSRGPVLSSKQWFPNLIIPIWLKPCSSLCSFMSSNEAKPSVDLRMIIYIYLRLSYTEVNRHTLLKIVSKSPGGSPGPLPGLHYHFLSSKVFFTNENISFLRYADDIPLYLQFQPLVMCEINMKLDTHKTSCSLIMIQLSHTLQNDTDGCLFPQSCQLHKHLYWNFFIYYRYPSSLG